MKVKSKMKTAMAVAAVAALGAFAPAMASAEQWSSNGVTVGGAPGVAVTGSGSLSWSWNWGVVITTTCNAQMTANLFNQAGVAGGQVTSFGVASPMTNCTVVGVSNCRVTNVVAANFPWAVTTAGTSATISGISFSMTHGRINPANPCALEGNRSATGNITGTVTNSPSRLRFTNAAGLTFNPGSFGSTVNGSLNLVGTGGQTITLS